MGENCREDLVAEERDAGLSSHVMWETGASVAAFSQAARLS